MKKLAERITQPDPIEQGDPALDPRAFRRSLGQFATGVTIITTEHEGVLAGVTANSFSSLSLDPPLILWSIARSSRSFSIFEKTGHFAINILSAQQIAVSQQFSSAETDKFAGMDWEYGIHGSPILDGTIATFECTTETTYDGGDHLILIGRVRRYARYPGDVMLYVQGQYGIMETHPDLRKELATENAPYIPADGEPPFSTLLYFAHHYSLAAFEKHRREEGLSMAQSRIIFTLNNMPGLRFDALVHRIYLSELIAEDAVAQLLKMECIERDAEARLFTTEKGRRILAGIGARMIDYEANLLNGIPQADIATARRVLSTFIERLEPIVDTDGKN